MEGWVAFGLSCYRLFPVSWFLDIDEKFEVAQRECAVDGPGIINPGLVAIEYRVELEFLRVSDADIRMNYIICLLCNVINGMLDKAQMLMNLSYRNGCHSGRARKPVPLLLTWISCYPGVESNHMPSKMWD